MGPLVRAELLKLTSTRMLRWMAVCTLAIVGLNVALNVTMAGRGEAPALTTADGVNTVFAAAGTGMTLMLVVGIMSMSGEFRHGTATSTFLTTSRRRRVIQAKAAAAGLAGLAFGILAVVLTLAMGLPWLLIEGASVDSFTGPASILAGSVFVTAVAGALGVGIGSVIRNQTVAVAAGLSWVLILESLLGGLAPSVGRWSLNGATSSLVTAVGTGYSDRELLPWYVAAGLVLAYTSLALTAGVRALRRADI